MLGIYSRQSTNKQQSIPFQKELGEKFAKENSLKFKHYSEKGISGGAKLNKRVEFTRLLDDIQDGKIDKVFIWVQDRAEREPLTWHTLCNTIIEANAELYENGVLVALEDDMVYTMRGITSLMNRAERRKNNKRVKEKLINNAEKGRIFALVPYGYTKDINNLMVVEEDEAEVIKIIFKMSSEGLGYSAIANYLNDAEIPTRYNKIAERAEEIEDNEIQEKMRTYVVDINRNNELPEKMVTKSKANSKWVSGTIRNILHNKTYIGKRTFSGKEYECPAIIEKDDFIKVHQNIKNKVKKSGKRSKNNFILNNLVFCSNCGRRYTGVRVNKHTYYRCASRIKKGGSCGNTGIKTDMLEAFVWLRFFLGDDMLNLVKENLKGGSVKKKIESLEVALAKNRSELISLETKRKRIVELIIEEVITNEDGKGQLKSIEDKKGLLEQDNINYNEELIDLNSNAKKTNEIIGDKKTIRDNTTYLKRKEIIEKYIKSVHVLGISKELKDFGYILVTNFNLPIDSETYVTRGNEFLNFDKTTFKIVPD